MKTALPPPHSSRSPICVAALLIALLFPAWANEPLPLWDEMSPNKKISGNTRNLIICVHGWNPLSRENMYQGPEWSYLVAQIKTALRQSTGEPWSLLLYRWENAAATGFISTKEGFLAAHAYQAAINAALEGNTLGPRLPSSLRRVHFIAHSAGSWLARAAAEWLVAERPYLIVQVTLLDPYIPAVVLSAGGTMNEAAMAQMAHWNANYRIRRLENYYADDRLPGKTELPTFGTQSEFGWRVGDLNLQVEWSLYIWPYRSLNGIDLHYDWHSGPITFYGDTLWFALNSTHGIPPGLNGAPYAIDLVGWPSGLFAARNSMPTFDRQPVAPPPVSVDANVELSVTARRAQTFLWYRNGNPLTDATSASHSFVASEATKGEYVLRAEGAGGMLFSDAVEVTLASSSPTSFTITPSSGPNGTITPKSAFSRSAGSAVLFLATPYAGFEVAYWYLNGLQAQVGGANYTITRLQADTVVQVSFRQTVTAPITGDLLVTVTPQAAANAGAQWRFVSPVIGNYSSPDALFQYLGPGQYQIGFKPISGYTTPANQTVNVVAGQTQHVTGTYTAVVTCSASLSPYSDVFPAAGGTGAFNVVAPTGCTWTASENVSWVTITSGSSGSGTHAVFYQVEPNPSLSQRSGAITVAGNSFTINQNGDSGACTYVLSSPGASMPAEGGGGAFAVLAGPSCFWAISRSANWITLLSAQDHTGNDSVQYEVQPHFGSEPRSAAISLSADGGQTFVATFAVTQAGTPPPAGTLATGLSYPVSVAVDDTYAYWTEASGKVLKRVLKAGGQPTTLATSLYGFGQMALDGDYVYYLDSGTKVQKLLKSGGTAATLAAGSSFYEGITVQDNTVFWGASGVIYSVPVTGGIVTTVAASPTSSRDISSIRVSDNVVFWSQTMHPGTVFMQSLSGGPRTTLPSGWNVNPGLAIQDNVVYLAGADGVYRVPSKGGALETLATNLNDAYDLVLDEANVFWLEAGNPTGTDGSVRQMPLSGGIVTTLATNLAQPVAIAIDPTNVYWLERNNGKSTRSALKWAAKATAVRDVVPPSMSITNPRDGAHFNESSLSMSGTAADNVSVAFVELRLNAGVWETATGTANWTGVLTLAVGPNTIEGRSRDSAGNYSAIASVVVTYFPPDAKLPQVIDFGQLRRQAYGDAPFPLFATASSELPVAFSVLAGPAVVNGNIITLIGPGLVVLRASQAGDATYAPAPDADQVLIVARGRNVVTDGTILEDGAFIFRFYGDEESEYVAEYSTDLNEWIPCPGHVIKGLDYWEFTDPDAALRLVSFYRVRSQ